MNEGPGESASQPCFKRLFLRIYYNKYLYLHLTGQSKEIFKLQFFFHHSILPGPLNNVLKYFRTHNPRPTAHIQHPTTLIFHRTSLSSHNSPHITHPSSFITQPSSLITHPLSLAPHHSPLFTHPSSLTPHRSHSSLSPQHSPPSHASKNYFLCFLSNTSDASITAIYCIFNKKREYFLFYVEFVSF